MGEKVLSSGQVADFSDSCHSRPVDETAKIKTEIKLLESALQNCDDTNIRKQVEDWIKEQRRKLEKWSCGKPQ